MHAFEKKVIEFNDYIMTIIVRRNKNHLRPGMIMKVTSSGMMNSRNCTIVMTNRFLTAFARLADPYSAVFVEIIQSVSLLTETINRSSRVASALIIITNGSHRDVFALNGKEAFGLGKLNGRRSDERTSSSANASNSFRPHWMKAR